MTEKLIEFSFIRPGEAEFKESGSALNKASQQIQISAMRHLYPKNFDYIFCSRDRKAVETINAIRDLFSSEKKNIPINEILSLTISQANFFPKLPQLEKKARAIAASEQTGLVLVKHWEKAAKKTDIIEILRQQTINWLKNTAARIVEEGNPEKRKYYILASILSPLPDLISTSKDFPSLRPADVMVHTVSVKSKISEKVVCSEYKNRGF
jgi:hypothetical protein